MDPDMIQLITNMMAASGHSDPMQMLINSDMNPETLRTNATLREDEWKEVDLTVVDVARERLVGVADLIARNLTHTITNGLGTTILEWDDVSDLSPAEVNMSGVQIARNDRVDFTRKSVPLPITHKAFQLNARSLIASRRLGEPLNVTQARISARKVADSLEDTLFNGLSTYTFDGGTIYGYLDFPDRNAVTPTEDGAWDDSAKTGEQIIDNVKDAKQASIDAKHYGPWVMYIPTAYETVLDCDFKANSDKTIRQRILEISGIEEVKVADVIVGDKVVLVEMQEDTVRQVQGMPLTTVEWSRGDNMLMNFRVMTISVPNIRADQDGNSGVTTLELTPA